jgi:hypothetical protein
MFQLHHFARVSGGDTHRPASLTSTAIAATIALLTVTLLWPENAARAATPTCLGQAATVVGTSADDTLPGTPGDDVIVGRRGDDVIRGGGGNDLICGNGGADTLRGGDGDDTLSGGARKDDLLGGAGEDTADYASSTSGVNVNLATGQATGEGTDRLRGIGRVHGSDYGGDLLTASDAGSTLDGGFEADILIGGASADILLSVRPTPTPTRWKEGAAPTPSPSAIPATGMWSRTSTLRAPSTSISVCRR